MQPVTFVVSLCKLYAVGLILCSIIAHVHEIEVNDILTWKFVYFQKIFRFLLHNTRDVTKGQGDTISRAPNHYGGAKSHSNVITTFFKTVGLHLLPKDLRFEHGGAKLASFPRRHVTSLRSCTSRLSSQNDEICLQKYLSISGKLSITNYLKQNAVDYRSHLTIENNLKVEKRYIISKIGTTFTPPKKTHRVRAETNIPKNSKATIMLAICPGRCL